MSLKAFKKDLEFWERSEENIGDMFVKLGRRIERTEGTDILDFKLIDKKGREVWMELKTRRCKKDDYPDSMIGMNKVVEAFKRYDKSWLYTIFLFKFTDWLYYVNPFFVLPRFDYKAWRWDRGWFDKKKWYAYYNVSDLKLINK